MTQNSDGDRTMIGQTLDEYFEGMHHSRGDLIEQSFHENGTVCGFGSNGGERMDMDRAGFAAFVSSQPAPADNGEPFDMKIKSLDIKGRVAMANVDDLYLGKRFTDYLLLVKDGEKWTILNKVWHADPA